VHDAYDGGRDWAPEEMTKILLIVIVVLIAYVLYLRTNRRR
jgi:hypothetical protein